MSKSALNVVQGFLRHLVTFHKIHLDSSLKYSQLLFLCVCFLLLFCCSCCFFFSECSYPTGTKKNKQKSIQKKNHNDNNPTMYTMPSDKNPSCPSIPVFQLFQACPSCWGLRASLLRLALWSDPCRSWRILSQRSGQLYRDQKIPPPPEKDWSQSEAAGKGGSACRASGGQSNSLSPK